jgi:hypothetical protein
MPRKKKSTNSPVEIQFTFLIQDDGSLIVSYEGTDSRTHSVGQSVVNAIADAYGFVPTHIARRG